MKKLLYLTFLLVLSTLMVSSCQDSRFSEQGVLGSTAQENGLTKVPKGQGQTAINSTGAANVLQKQVDHEGFVVNSFSCLFFQFSPCDGIRYDVTGECTIGVKETILPSGEEQVLLRIRFEGEGQEYSLRLSHSAQFGNIANQYNVAGVRGVWSGRGDAGGDLPNFQTLSSGTVFISNGTPVGMSLSTTSAKCFVDAWE